METPRAPTLARQKIWLSPFIAVAFAIVAATGVLLFFHIKNGSLLALHEWFGWLLVVAGGVHVALNLRPLLGYLRRPAAWAATGVALALAAVLAIGGARHQAGHHRHGYERPAVPSSSSAIP